LSIIQNSAAGHHHNILFYEAQTRVTAFDLILMDMLNKEKLESIERGLKDLKEGVFILLKQLV
jgi:hypothetical protein